MTGLATLLYARSLCNPGLKLNRCILQPVLILEFTVLVENEINKMIIQLLAIFFQFDT